MISDETGYIKQFDLYDSQLVEDEKIHDGIIYSMELSKDGKYLFTSDSEGNLKQWDVRNQIKLLKDWGQIHENPIHSIVISVDGRYLFTTDTLGYVKSWRIKRQQLLKVVRFHFSKIMVSECAIKIY